MRPFGDDDLPKSSASSRKPAVYDRIVKTFYKACLTRILSKILSRKGPITSLLEFQISIDFMH